MVQLAFPPYNFKIRNSDKNTKEIFDPVRKKYFLLTPEEWVRQHVIQYLNEKGYPLSLMSVEKEIELYKTKKRFDILVSDSTGKPLLLVECKAPEVKISQDTFDQITRYNATLKVPLLVVTNGMSIYCVEYKEKGPEFLNYLPEFALSS